MTGRRHALSEVRWTPGCPASAVPVRGANLIRYRGKAGKEADAIVEFDDGRWAAFEVKLGQRQIPAAQASLAALVADIDAARTPPPVFTAVITADGPVMPLHDGAITFPLNALGP